MLAQQIRVQVRPQVGGGLALADAPLDHEDQVGLVREFLFIVGPSRCAGAAHGSGGRPDQLVERLRQRVDPGCGVPMP